MTQYAWVIDQTRCIGCHACTTACKSENDVALGVFRTWVKAVEVGTFPEVRRHFAVMRCNHCADPPCVDICPVSAMYQRPDGLVDFNHDTCIGCKACMQACPYDAIYMDPDEGTAAKCNFCSHRVDEGLLPACVVVCPEEALLFGDLEDPLSAVSKALGAHPVTVRRADQGTRPKAFYIGAHEAALDPLAARHDGMYAWADAQIAAPPGTSRRERAADDVSTHRRTHAQPARVAYDVPRQRAWGWRVSAYIWTKSIAAGAGLVAAADRAVGTAAGSAVSPWLMPVVAMVFLVATGALLIADLKRPERFWTILVRPQWKSWLARGAVIITLYGAVLAAWLVCEWLGAEAVLDALSWLLGLLALLTGVYTAALFAQCEGRDLWQSPLLAVALALEVPLAGLAIALLAAPGARTAALGLRGQTAVLLVALGAVQLLDTFGPHASANARAAAHALAFGRQSSWFWGGLFLGIVLPMAPVAGSNPTPLPVVGALVLAGLWMHHHAYVLAGQGPPIS